MDKETPKLNLVPPVSDTPEPIDNIVEATGQMSGDGRVYTLTLRLLQGERLTLEDVLAGLKIARAGLVQG